MALLGIAQLVLQPRVEAIPDYTKALVGLLAILAIDVASSIVDLSPLARMVPQATALGYAFWPWLPVLLWGYVLGLTYVGPDEALVGKGHFATALVASMCLLPLFLLPGRDRLAIADGTFALVSARQLIMALGLVVFVLLWAGHMIAVAMMISRRLIAHRRRMRDLLSETSTVDLRWLDGFMLFLALAISTAIADQLLAATTGFELLGTVSASLIELLIILGLALFGLGQSRAIPPWASEPDEEAPVDPPHPDKERRYARSSLSAADCAAIITPSGRDDDQG